MLASASQAVRCVIIGYSRLSSNVIGERFHNRRREISIKNSWLDEIGCLRTCERCSVQEIYTCCALHRYLNQVMHEISIRAQGARTPAYPTIGLLSTPPLAVVLSFSSQPDFPHPLHSWSHEKGLLSKATKLLNLPTSSRTQPIPASDL